MTDLYHEVLWFCNRFVFVFRWVLTTTDLNFWFWLSKVLLVYIWFVLQHFQLKKYYITYLLYRDTLICGGWKPYLTFDFVLITHQFNPTPYFRTYQDRKTIRDKVWKLHKLGWGYTKIHHYLVDNGYEVGKSRTVVDSMIKKRTKRELILNQPILVDKYVDFRLEVLKNWIKNPYVIYVETDTTLQMTHINTLIVIGI